VLLLGAGGAAHSIGNVLAAENAKLVILNREQKISTLKDLAQRLAQSYGAEVKVEELTNENLKKAITDVDIMVNATSIGMSPDNDQTPVPAELLHANLTVFDIIYNPLPTRLLREAKAAGAMTIDGLEMLVQQGAVSFEKWTAKQAPVDIMRKSVESILRRNEK
jgi:shikimate dehydrogenase